MYVRIYLYISIFFLKIIRYDIHVHIYTRDFHLYNTFFFFKSNICSVLLDGGDVKATSPGFLPQVLRLPKDDLQSRTAYAATWIGRQIFDRRGERLSLLTEDILLRGR